MRRLKPPGMSPGFTLVEVGIASVLMAAIMAGALMFVSDQLSLSAAQARGGALAALNNAVNQYESLYVSNLSNHTAISIPGYGYVVNPYAPTPTELTELGILKTNVPSGIYGISISSTVTNGTTSGLVWLINPFNDNLGRPSQDLAGAAMLVAGGDAAISTVSNPSVVEGVDGWTVTNPVANTAAILAMRNGAGSAAYVRLDGSTPMQGSLSFNSHDLTNVNNFSTNSATVTGNLTTGGSVTAAGNVTAGGSIAASGNTSGSTLTATATGNDVFFGSSALYSDGWNTVIRNTNGALYVQDFNGNNEPVVASQFVANAGNGVSVGNSYYYGDGSNSAIRQDGQLYIQNRAGSAAASLTAQRLTADEYVQVNGGAASGAGCSPNGLIAQDGSGNLLSCVNGAWKYPGSSTSGSICGYVTNLGTTGSLCQGYNPYVSCPPGYNRIHWDISQFGSNNELTFCASQ